MANFINVLQAAPKSEQKTVTLLVSLALLGSVRTRAAVKMLVKLTPGEHHLHCADWSLSSSAFFEKLRLFSCLFHPTHLLIFFSLHL